MAGKLDFDFPSNNELVKPDRTVTMAWAQLFTRWQWIIGARKTWQDMLPFRLFNTDYVNGTGRPITVSVRVTSNAVASGVILVDGVQLNCQSQTTIGTGMWCYAEIPNGATYRVTVTAGTGVLQTWHEYR